MYIIIKNITENIKITLYGNTVINTFNVSLTSAYPSININLEIFKNKSLIHLYERFNVLSI